MVKQQADALRLADIIEMTIQPHHVQHKAAAELRRLHAELTETTKANEWLQTVNARVASERNELLKVLQGYMAGIEAMGWNTDKAKAAIAKATGGQQ